MQALRKPLEKDVGITAPRICVETITPSLVSIVEVSQASHIQDEDITPLNYFKCFGESFLCPFAKLIKDLVVLPFYQCLFLNLVLNLF